jgi:RHS repeat-associated protein
VLYLRSSVLGGQVVAEMDYVNGAWQWQRGYVYQGSQLLAVQQNGVFWVHEDPVTKSKRVTDANGNVVSTLEPDPWGAYTNRYSNGSFQPREFTSYERDGNRSDEAMFRRYNRWHSRFDQPDPYDGSYSLTDPQSFNRYAYTQNDPVNFTDPTGLLNWPLPIGPPPSTVDVPISFDSPIDAGFTSGGRGLGVNRPRLLLPLDPIGKGGNTGGQTGKAPQKTNTPAKTNPQQKDFDDCATKANRRYRSEYLRTSTKAMAGGAGVAAGWLVGGLAFKGAMHAAGDVALPAFARILTTGIELGDAGVIVTISSYVSGKAALDAIREGERNSNRRTSEIEDCKKSFPNANHSFSTLNF